eukprot:2100158-Rhodomonas_salina.1
MADAHTLLGALLQQRQHFKELVDGFLELGVRLPVAELLGHALAQSLKPGGCFGHAVDLGNNFRPHI